MKIDGQLAFGFSVLSLEVAIPARCVTVVLNSELEELIETCYPRIRRAALVMCGRPCEADDLAQETFLQALQSWPQFAGKSRVETWLYGILIRIHGKRRRSAGRAWARWLTWFQTRPTESCDTANQVLELQEWKESLWPAVARLSLVQQQVLILRHSEDLPLSEIAKVLGCPVGTVKSRLHQGLAALQKILVSHGGPELAAAVCIVNEASVRSGEF